MSCKQDGRKEGMNMAKPAKTVPKRKKRVRSSLLTKVILLVALVFVGVQLFMLHDRISTAKAEEAALAQQIALQQQENDALQRQIDSGDDPDLIEEIARNDGLVKPGEKVFYDVSN